MLTPAAQPDSPSPAARARRPPRPGHLRPALLVGPHALYRPPPLSLSRPRPRPFPTGRQSHLDDPVLCLLGSAGADPGLPGSRERRRGRVEVQGRRACQGGRRVPGLRGGACADREEVEEEAACGGGRRDGAGERGEDEGGSDARWRRVVLGPADGRDRMMTSLPPCLRRPEPARPRPLGRKVARRCPPSLAAAQPGSAPGDRAARAQPGGALNPLPPRPALAGDRPPSRSRAEPSVHRHRRRPHSRARARAPSTCPRGRRSGGRPARGGGRRSSPWRPSLPGKALPHGPSCASSSHGTTPTRA